MSALKKPPTTKRGLVRACTDKRCLTSPIGFGIVAMAKEEFARAKIVGTDIISRDKKDIIEHDFHEQNRRWVGRFNMVYSNSLDHAYDPEKALRCWFEQLSDNGYLFVQWTRWHIGIRGGDCFGASLHEYILMMNSIGVVVDVMWHYKTVFTIVGRRRK